MENELLFMAMDIPKETRKLVHSVTVTEGMTNGELKAYEMGINNTLNALKTILEIDDDVVVHITDIDIPTEMDIDEIAEIVGEDDYE